MSAVSCAWTGPPTVAHSRTTSRGTIEDRRRRRAVLSRLSTVIVVQCAALVLSGEISRRTSGEYGAISDDAISEREKTAAGAWREYMCISIARAFERCVHCPRQLALMRQQRGQCASSLKSAFVGSCASFGLSTAQLEEMERISELPHRRPEAMSTSTWRRRARLASSSRREREEDPSAQAPHVIAERPPSPGRHLSCSGSLYSCHQHSNE